MFNGTEAFPYAMGAAAATALAGWGGGPIRSAAGELAWPGGYPPAGGWPAPPDGYPAAGGCGTAPPSG
ncbi:hypothetical protein Ate01nite_12630 [Actinoplanes teichomyceticus]|nr:hypothetical protein Ate01nite_12630 [Actinoplanes teichomyceticus]